MLASYPLPHICLVHIMMFGFAPVFGWLPHLLSDFCMRLRGGNNLFGKYGPNLDLSVGLVLFLGWVYMLVLILV